MTDSINQFIDDLEFHSADHAAVAQKVRALYQEIEPTITEKFIYGGIGFYLGETHLGGVYAHKNYLNIVFGRGNELADPDGLLEGKGKFRRFVRAAVVDDIDSQRVHDFIEQRINLEKNSS